MIKTEESKSAEEEKTSKLIIELETLQRFIKEDIKRQKEDRILCENTTRKKDILERSLLRSKG